MTVLQDVRLALIRNSVWFSKAIGKVGNPFVNRWCGWADVAPCRSVIKPGMCLVSRKRMEATNLFIPGRYTHACIVSADPTIVIEAIGVGVVRTTIEGFLLSHDEVVAFEPIFANDRLRSLAAIWAENQVGKQYDFLFNDDEGRTGDSAFFCSELVYKAYSESEGDIVPTMKRYETLGVYTVTPDDFVQARNKWRPLWASARVPKVFLDEKYP